MGNKENSNFSSFEISFVEFLFPIKTFTLIDYALYITPS
jgi:hypothetical protein